MSIKTTYDIDRKTAIAVIVDKVYNASNDELEDILEGFKESHFRNYIVYDELPEPERYEYSLDFRIENPNQF